MDVLKNHWVTLLALVGAAFLLVTGITMLATGGEDGETGIRVFGAFSVVAGVATLVGLQAMRTGSLDVSIARALVIIGMVWLGAGFWWFVFLPPILAIAVLYFGIYRQRLPEELAST